MKAVVVFAKAPEPGRVKTRLCPPLTAVEAAALQRACLGDLWVRLRCLPETHPVLCYDPPQAAGLFRSLLGREADLLEQSEGDLGQRLSAAFDALFARGLGPVAAVGADSPDLPLATLLSGLSALETEECDVALAPAEDGGYTVIALRRPHPELFEAIPWSTEGVFSSTMERCRSAGLRVHTLPPWYDVDDPATLARLRASVLACPDKLPRLHRLFTRREG